MGAHADGHSWPPVTELALHRQPHVYFSLALPPHAPATTEASAIGCSSAWKNLTFLPSKQVLVTPTSNRTQMSPLFEQCPLFLAHPPPALSRNAQDPMGPQVSPPAAGVRQAHYRPWGTQPPVTAPPQRRRDTGLQPCSLANLGTHPVQGLGFPTRPVRFVHRARTGRCKNPVTTATCWPSTPLAC